MNTRSTTKRALGRISVLVALLGALTGAMGAPSQLAYAAGSAVAVWGHNINGQLDVPAGLNDVIAIAAGYAHNLAVKSDGMVVAWGSNSSGQANVPAGLSGVTAVAGGVSHSLALKGDGTVVAWGCAANNFGQCIVPAGLSGVTAIAAGWYHNLALKSDGSVVAWAGNNSVHGMSDVPAGLSGVIAVAGGQFHSLALKGDGTVVAWGCRFADSGQCDVPAGLSGVTAIAAHSSYNLALKGDGTIVAWGQNNGGQTTIPTGLSGVSAIAAGPFHGLALKGDGTVIAWGCGQNNGGQCNVPAGLSGVTAVAGGNNLSMVIKLDTTPPTITPNVAGTLGSNGWFVGDVAVSWSVTDAESAITSQTGCDAVTINTDTAGTTLTCTATSAGGTNSQFVTIKLDKTAPTISGSASPAPNAAGWNNTDVTVSFSCNDALSGVEGSGVASCGPNQTLNSEGASLSAGGTATDQGGNMATATVSGVKLDKTAPALTPVVNPNPVLLGGTATVSSGAADALSGLASQSCGTLDAGSVGAKTVTCTATDNAGNSASANASYSVIYTWSSFFQPVDNLPVFNQVKAGQAVPVKFSLAGNQGLSILATGSPASQQIACDTSVPTMSIEETVSAGNSSLSYDTATGIYTYVWKTEKGWANTCRQFIVTLADGTQHLANFKFK